MSINTRTLAIAAVVLLGAGIYLARGLLFSGGMSDHELLLLRIDEAAAAAEQRDLKRLMAGVAESYRDDQGRDRQAVAQLLRALFIMQQRISVYVVNKEVEVEGADAATGRVDAVITRGVKVKVLADLVPQGARAVRFSLRWIKEGEEWLLRSAAWTDIPNVKELLR